MSVRPINADDFGTVTSAASRPATAPALRQDISHHIKRSGIGDISAGDSSAHYRGLIATIRDRLMEGHVDTQNAAPGRRVSYLSLEFLIGRLLRNAFVESGS